LSQSKLFSEESTNETLHNQRPLVVDLDGTLIHTDMLHESAIRLLRNKPHFVLAIPFWLFRGKALLKQKLASHVDVNITSLPFNQKLINWLQSQKDLGRKLVLCTATDMSIAKRIADHLKLFDDVIASDGIQNLAGRYKANALVEKYGENGFDYVGNSSVDLLVWEKSKKGVIVNGSSKLVQQASLVTRIEHLISKSKNSLKTWVKVFRLHQWIKNVLIFVPIFAAHQVMTSEVWINLGLAFLSFSLCASSVYITNDLLDLESDRAHLRKRSRPFAAGQIPILIGAILAPILILSSFTMAQHVGGSFLSWLVVYFGMTCAYSWGLKRLVLVDCLTLAILYSLRIVAGAAAASVPLSFWLLAFSIFLFFSLAFIKRYAELKAHPEGDAKKVHGRGYYLEDAPLVQQLGITSGYAATLVLAFYLNSENVIKLYRTPEMIWGAVPLMLLWISWMWLKVHRGLMLDDPVVFAIKDKVSVSIGILFMTILILARVCNV
jgi:4-hydroxybenzoate polyprenyltransferase/phosphoserine phosphatase